MSNFEGCDLTLVAYIKRCFERDSNTIDFKSEFLETLFFLNTPEQMLLTLNSTNKIKVNRQKLFFYLPFFQ